MLFVTNLYYLDARTAHSKGTIWDESVPKHLKAPYLMTNYHFFGANKEQIKSHFGWIYSIKLILFTFKVGITQGTVS